MKNIIKHTWNDDGYDKEWAGKIISTISKRNMYEVLLIKH